MPVVSGTATYRLGVGRELRSEEPGGIYHVISRGNNRGRLYWDELDREVFLGRLSRVAQKYGWAGLAYCLMTNHFHLVVQILEGGLSAGMQELNGEYARRANRRHGRVGHLFQNRFFADWITTDGHLFGAIRYVALNPVRAGICQSPADYPWSSHRASAGLEFPIDYLAFGRLQRLFGTSRAAAQASYCRLVELGRVSVSDTGVVKKANEAKASAFASKVLT
jgi:REP element-mobilizing transposase RayT